jgi:drug/metabolite transporter (DMT)-like permease
MPHSAKATLIGQVGLCMWAVVGALIALIKHLPTQEILLFVFSISFVVSVLLLSVTKKWHKVKSQKPALWLFNMVGICGTEALFILASKNAPQAEVNLINYLWPTLIILLAPLLPREKFHLKYLISAVLAFSGITILLTQGQGLSALDLGYSMGYLYAFCCAFAWAIYTLTARYYTHQVPEAIGLYCGLGAIAILVMHPQLEFLVPPSTQDLLLLVFMGITSHNLAYMCWTHGVSYGNFKLLSLLVYLSPFISLGTLVLLDITLPSTHLWSSAALVCSAGVISAVDWQKIRNKNSPV